MMGNALNPRISGWKIAGIVALVLVLGIVAWKAYQKIEYAHWLATKPTPEPMSVDDDSEYAPGTYKVGADIRPGEYLLSHDGEDPIWFELTKDGVEVASGNDGLRFYVTVEEGDVLKFRGGRLNVAAYMSGFPGSGGHVLTEGMYLAGKDFPAGRYKVGKTAGSTAAKYTISADSRHRRESVIDSSTVTGAKWVIIKNGQYILLENCWLYLDTAE